MAFKKIEIVYTFASIKMDEEKTDNKLIYSWGPLYETLKEMEKNGDDHKDEKLEYAFQLFEKLDKVKTVVQVRKMVVDGLRKISSDEQKRWNSPCFDGIVETIHFNSPIQKILEKYPQHIETFKYYLLRTPEKRRKELYNFVGKYNRIEYIQILGKSVKLSREESADIVDKNLKSPQFLEEFAKEKEFFYYVNSSTIEQLIKCGSRFVREFCYSKNSHELAMKYIVDNKIDISSLDPAKVINKVNYDLLFGSSGKEN